MPARSKAANNPFVALVRDVQRVTERRLRLLLAARQRRARAEGPAVGAMVGAMSELVLRGGKRLRPALVAAGLRAARPRADLAPAIELGLSLELLHSYLLIHDDWMDGDELRRGGPTVHKLLAKRFGSESQGEKSAILAGDYAMGVALELLSEVALEPARQAAIFREFARMHSDAIFGQQLDLSAATSDPERVYVLKTANYTVQGPLLIGALLGAASPALLAALGRFARPAGVAFQLRDDLLGAFADSKITGKPRGSDLRAGKFTLLVKLGRARTRGKERALLERVLSGRSTRRGELEQALLVLERSGARALVEARIAELVAAAHRAISSKAITAEGRSLLAGALEALAERPS